LILVLISPQPLPVNPKGKNIKFSAGMHQIEKIIKIDEPQAN
jgi:hypothetical protein